MAVTDRPAGRAERRRRKRRLWRDLPWLAAGVGSLAARHALGQDSSVDTRVLFYQESGRRTQVLDPMILLKKDFGETWGQLGLVVGYDAISGASPTGGYPTSDVTTSASGRLVSANTFPQADYRDTRFSGSLSYGRRFGAHLPTVDVSYAKENDYVARSIGLSDEWTMAHGLGTLHFGASVRARHRQPGDERPPPLQVAERLLSRLHVDPRGAGSRRPLRVGAPALRISGRPVQGGPDRRSRYGNGAGASPGYTVPPGHRREVRSPLPVGRGPQGHLSLLNDDWSIQAHTLEVVYDQRLFTNWLVTPQVRFYTQTGASFYGSRFSSPQTFLSSDYRLSPLDSALGGLTVTRKLTDSLSVDLGGTYQYQRGRDRVIAIPRSTGEDGEGPRASSASAADMTVFTITAGFTKRF